MTNSRVRQAVFVVLAVSLTSCGGGGGGGTGGGATTTCGPTNCNGCCPGSGANVGVCQTGALNSFCGANGSTCDVCGSAQACVAGKCETGGTGGGGVGGGGTGGGGVGGGGVGGGGVGSGGGAGGGGVGSGGGAGGGACTPTTCAAQGKNCGSISDACGGTLTCGSCTSPATCGGTGATNVCGCTPTTCAAQGKNCGSLSDGCGLSLNCGSCVSPGTCGGAGMANVCGTGTCTPTTCAAQNKSCGSLSDGCGVTLDCGACGAGYTCQGTSCSALPPSVTVTVAFPNLFDLNSQKVLPTYVSHIILAGESVAVTKVTLTNTGGPATFQVSAGIPTYGTPTLQTVLLMPAETTTVSINPVISFMQLFQNTTAVPAGITVNVTAGTTPVFGQTFPIQITGRNTVFWNRGGAVTTNLIATMVTPQDKGLAIQNLLRDSANLFPGNTPSLIGYQLSAWPSGSYALSPGTYQQEPFFILQGDSPDVTVTSVAGGIDNNFAVYILDDANFTKWVGGMPATACAASSMTPSSGVALQCPTPATGWYHIVYLNPSNNFVSRTVTRTRSMLKWEVSYYQAKAIFEELRAKGLVYINLTGSGFFASAQNVRYPVESVTGMGANCIDGSLLFASAFEALGMEPLLGLSFTAGHAIMAVRCWSGSNCIIPIDTTYVGTPQTFGDAFNAGSGYWDSWTTGGSLQSVDIKAARALGLTPAPM